LDLIGNAMTVTGPTGFRRTNDKVRGLTAEDLGVPASPVPVPSAGVPEELTPLDSDEPILTNVEDLLQSYGGVIFTGPPGTSKSWYAARVGISLVNGDRDRLRIVQFHPSYQYEDFVQGYVPKPSGDGFTLEPKHFLQLCIDARHNGNDLYVLVIDELSRGDPGRVFGEALTYLERSKRGIEFSLASGTKCVVPTNLVVLATMNPLDRGVDEVDAALERRFAKIAMDPDDALLTTILNEAGMRDELRVSVVGFFKTVNERARRNPFAALGHTYFVGCADEDDLRRLWAHQLRFHFEKAFRLDATGLDEVRRTWDRVLGGQPITADDEVAEDDAAPSA
jgi:5-methylcytosine-specific restriction protein B